MPIDPFTTNPEQFFSFLKEEHVLSAQTYFNYNQTINTNKISRKESGLPYSFINTPNGIFAISSKTLGAGSSAKVKIAKYVAKTTTPIIMAPINYEVINNDLIEIGQLVAVKIILTNVVNPISYNCKRWKEEVEILNQLQRLFSTTKRHWVTTQLTPTKYGWKNKYEKDPNYRNEEYNFKFYIFNRYYPGITLAKYFREYHPSTEETLIILIKALEQLEILHNQDIVHGDASFSNFIICIHDKEIVINFIDCGLSGKLTYGIRKFPVCEYQFTKKNYSPPECDYELVLKKIIPELVCRKPSPNLEGILEEVIEKLTRSTTKQPITKEKLILTIISTINAWASEGYGFNINTSDLYSFGWNIFFYANGAYNTALRELQPFTYIFNPAERPPVQFLITQYKEKLKTITSQKNLLSYFSSTTTAQLTTTSSESTKLETVEQPKDSEVKTDPNTKTDPESEHIPTEHKANPIPIKPEHSPNLSFYISPASSGFSSDTLDATTSVPTLTTSVPTLKIS